MAKSRKKPRFIHMRFRKGDPAHNLLAATQHWVKANGGSLVVIGGIGLMNESSDGNKFSIVIGCLGRPPIKPSVK